MPTFDEEKQDKKLAELRAQEEEELARVLSEKYGISYTDLSRVAINTDALRLITEEHARSTEVALFNQENKKLSLAVRSPNTETTSDTVKELEERGYSVVLFMVSRASLLRVWNMYKDISFAVETKAGVIDISGEDVQSQVAQMKDLDDVRKLIKETLEIKKTNRISRVIEIILAGAIFVESSDIHIEPEENDVRIRYRIDGVLTNIIKFDRETYRLFLSRIKLVSGLKLNVHNEAQDGRFSISIDETDTEVRTSILPDAYGESIVMRLLNPDTIGLSLEDLGIEKHLLSLLQHEIAKPNGMLLTTGPTGSGKTTTLYAFLTKIHKPEIKVLTIEDPVEYHLPGIVQTQVEEGHYTFASGLRSALRQDPDVIMIGEIRDEEVAETAIHSALTGHLVFSTLHTNNAAGAIPRLVDLGVNPKVIGSAVNVVMAQRLVRRLCEHCKKEVPIPPQVKEVVDSILLGIVRKEAIPGEQSKVWEPGGCEKCNQSGYKGRVGVYEAILLDEAVENLIPENPSEREIARVSKPQGILSMREDGIVKMLRGITSFEELKRVISLDEKTNQDVVDAKADLSK